MIQGFLILLIAFIVLIIGSIFDLKTREIPDWLNYGLIFLGIGFNLISTTIFWDINYILSSIFGLGACFLFGMLMYYSGQWGGGDSKMIMGLGALIGLQISLNTFLLGLIINIFIAGAIYGIIWSAVLAIRNKNDFLKEFKKASKDDINITIKKIVYVLSLILLVLILLFGGFFEKLLMGFLTTLLIFSYYLLVFSKSIENACMKKYVPVSKLTPGDWIVNDIYHKKKYITGPKELGVSEEQIAILKRYKIKKILIKVGIPFVPSFLLGFLLTLYVGNWFIYLF